MKKLILLAIAGALFMTACDDDDDKTDETKDTNQGTSQNTKDEGTTDSIDFNKFCDVIMGKACGYEIDETALAECPATYKSEAEAAMATCADKAKAYYNCVINVTVTPCEDPDDDACTCMDAVDDACKAKVEELGACMGI